MTEEKILKDEVLSEEQLEQVSGGNQLELSKDSQLLHDLGLVANVISPPVSGDYVDLESAESKLNKYLDVKRSWAKLGISMVQNNDGYNLYYDSTGKSIIQTAIKKSNSKLNFYSYL